MKKLLVGLVAVAFIAFGAGMAGAAPIVYDGAIPVPGTVSGSVPLNSFADPTLWDYWSFTLSTASVVTIDGHRTTSEMDPGINLYSGILTDTVTDGLAFCAGTGFIGCADDNNGIPHGVGGSFADPQIVESLGAGTYTVAIFDVLGAGPAPQYELHLSATTVVPEPSTLLLLGASLVGLAAWRRRA